MPVLFAGILLTFSRGAWINLAVSLAVYAFLIFSTASTHRQRLKLVIAAMVAAVVALGVLAAANSVSEVAELMRERASFDQSYDKGPEGRFGGQQKAARVILDYPLGLGAAVFHDKYHHEDVHEVYLSMFLNAGWVGGLTYVILVLLTLWLAARRAVQDRGGGGVSAVLCAAFIGMALEGLVIDSDHWRHFFLPGCLGRGARDARGGRSRQARVRQQLKKLYANEVPRRQSPPSLRDAARGLSSTLDCRGLGSKSGRRSRAFHRCDGCR